MNYNLNEILEIYSNETTITAAAKEYCRRNNIEYTDVVRRKISRMLSKTDTAKDSDLDNFTDTETNQYKKSETFNMPSAWSTEFNRFLSIEEYCIKYGLDINSVKSSKLVSHNQGHMVYNIAFYTPDEEVVVDIDNHLEEIVSKYIHPSVKYKISENKESSDVITRLVYSDTHIALDIKDSLYGGIWNKNELMETMVQMVETTIEYAQEKKSNILYITDLADLMDGYDGQTTRGGHSLPQNMNNKEAFDVAVEFKIEMINLLLEGYNFKKIVCHNVCNSNHGGDFEYFVNSTFKSVIEKWGDRVEVHNHIQFMSHYGVGDHCFINCHGKDSDDMKFGFKVHAGHQEVEKIDQYIKNNGLYSEYKFFHFCKGDSHQFLRDYSTSDDFNYFNYPALSPSSKWVQINFKKGMSGFVLESFTEHEEEIDVKYKRLKWKK